MAVAGFLGVLQGAPVARQLCSPQTLVRLGGIQPFGGSGRASISGNGRYVAFDSMSSDLDGDAVTDVFVYDRSTCALELISVSSTGVKGNQTSEAPSISDDGRYVVFVSRAANLVSSDVNGFSQDAFLRDRQLGQTTLISVDSAEVQPGVESAVSARISGNGQFVAFVSGAATLVAGDTNNEADVFVRDLVAGSTERVSISTAGGQGDSPQATGVFSPMLSADGRFVAFASVMNTLVPGDLNNLSDVFVRDRLMSTMTRASLRSDGTETTGFLSGHALTADGRLVVFSSNDNLVPGNSSCDGIFIRDLDLSTTTCAALDPANLSFSQNARAPAVSADGRYVAFTSSAAHHVRGDTNSAPDVFVHDRTTGMTRRASVSVSGHQVDSTGNTVPHISGDGQIVSFDSFDSSLVPPDPNGGTTDVFVAVWAELGSAAEVDLILNGAFANGLQHWQTFATPDSSYLVTDLSAGELRFYRLPPPPGTSNQAVVFHNSGSPLLARAPIDAQFRLGNSSAVRKRMSVLVHDADFSDLSVCTFWLEANAPMRSFRMRTHTTKFWTNATIAFYAASTGADGGFYRIDDVSLSFMPINDDDVTDCIDPTAPVAPGGAPGPTLLTNGDFSAGLAPWATFGQIIWQITNNTFDFVRSPGTPAGVVLQATSQPLAQHDILTAMFYLGNSSGVRKRVTVILHDLNFSDLSACTFWLAPNLPLSPYFVRTFTTKPWTNATFSLYPATVGAEEWIRFTDAVLQLTPGTTPLGTECLEPGANSSLMAARELDGFARGTGAARLDTGTAPELSPMLEPFIIGAAATPVARSQVLWQDSLDLRNTPNPRLVFHSHFTGDAAEALVQVSPDGLEWSTLASVLSSPAWSLIELDLPAPENGMLFVRLVFIAATPEDGAPAVWRVRGVRKANRPPVK